MDGLEMQRRVEHLLDEDAAGTWLDTRTTYDYLWEGAKRFVGRIECLTSYQDITTVADQVNYVLDAKFLKLYLTDRQNRYYVRYTINTDTDSTATINEGTAFAVGDTTLTVTDGTQFVVDNHILIEDEVLLVTAVSTNNLTVTRGFQDTTAAEHADLTAIYKRVSVYHTLPYKDYSEIIYANRVAGADAVDVPDHFSIRDKQSLSPQITGTVTAAGAASGGECTLTDSDALFTTTDYVSPGDTVHNTTDGSSGVVLSITSATVLVCALFGGTGNDWSYNEDDDNYVIQPQGRFELILDPPPDDASDIVRVWYVEVPVPVYSDYGTYRFRQHNIEHIVEYAAAKYKYRDNEPGFAKEFLGVWDRKVREEAFNLRPFTRERKWGVNLKKRR